ncbi:Glucooligosaccharide oxidase [Viridothelium virens]|uniref:Glucooligosaccharide oxidase n=1 Tax=Viridothelium virens TaxID=1048519 RepID=A0A6A6HH55_VIRVR|nr:Glucooligosaccharide oxidase [Viridothelium virens]
MPFSVLKAGLLASLVNAIAGSEIEAQVVIQDKLQSWNLCESTSSKLGNLTTDLQPLLSKDAQVFYPGSDGYHNATNRWSVHVKPGLDVIVRPASEKDVQRTVEYANAHEAPFLTIGGGHGTSNALNNIQGGIGIWMRGMRGIDFPEDGAPYATIHGGALLSEVVEALASHGKEGVTGGCDCTGFTGPMLGGGHGWLQGQYGLMADSLLTARVVLANGTAVSVSDTQHPDLFWALKGAGHNFGIVTSFTYRTFDPPEHAGFAHARYIFTQDKLEDVFSTANEWIRAKDRPVELTHYGVIAFNPEIDTKPIVIFLIYWQGAAIPQAYLDPFNALEPVSVVTMHVDLLGANANTCTAYYGPICEEGMSHESFPVDLDEWNPQNLRSVYEIYASMPAVLNNSVVLLEGFATNRVHEIPVESTSYAIRGSNLLAAPLFNYPPNNKTLDLMVIELGKQVRAILLHGTGLKLNAYVNYAHGDEGQKAVYGYEPWRLEKLRGLKKIYDPHGRFNFFEPIEF